MTDLATEATDCMVHVQAHSLTSGEDQQYTDQTLCMGDPAMHLNTVSLRATLGLTPATSVILVIQNQL